MVTSRSVWLAMVEDGVFEKKAYRTRKDAF